MRTAVCCILKNENHYIREWVEWYKNIGFTNVILYDNNDSDGEKLDEVIVDFINDGFAIIKDVRGKSKQQMPCYQSCYEEVSNKYDWIAFFDSDEFLEFDKNKNIDGFLGEEIFKEADFIKVCWKNFSDNGLVHVENNDYSIKRFTKTIEEKSQTAYLANRSTKIIVRTNLPNFHFFMEPGGEHGWHLPFKSVDCHGNSCDNKTQVIGERIWDNAWLNHYRFKTLEEFCTIKLSRLYAHCDANVGKLMLSKNEFFDYNEWTIEKDNLYHKFVGCDIVCCILNYKNDDNAVVWYNRCKNHYKTFLLDSYHLENGDVDKFPIHNDNIIFTENIYFGGQTIKSIELLREYDGKYLVAITSDVLCDDNNFIALTNALNNVILDGTIGVWEPSANNGSMCNGASVVIPTNIHQYCHGTGRMRDVVCGEGFFEVTKREICDYIYGYITPLDNKYGWGINDAYNRIARKFGLRVVIDDSVIVHHPQGTSYNNQDAKAEYDRFKLRFKEIGLEEQQDKEQHELKTLVCCIGRNENKYIREYVDWYKNLGVTNICLYDNNFDGDDDFNDVIKQDIDDGYVIYNNWRNKKDCQIEAYNDCYSRFGNDYDWILFIDCGDEYLELQHCKTINEYLTMPQFVNFDMIHVNLLTVGDNGLVKYDNRPLHVRFPEEIDHNTKIAYDFPENFHVSSIVRGGRNDVIFNKVGWSHTPVSDTLRCCNNIGFTVDGKSPFCPMDFTLAYFRHYTTKTAEEYVEKMKRGFPDQIWDGSRIKNLIETRFFKTNIVTQEKIDVFKKAFDLDFSYLLDKKYDGPKSDDVKIYSLCFEKKSFKFIDDEYVTPLQVGAANGTDVCELKDNVGDNISGINYFFIENTGTYWIWKNVNGAKYKGQMQYRRPLFGVNENMDIDKLFEQFDVITCAPFYHKEHNKPTQEEPMFIPANTVEEGYAFSNCIDDLYILEMVIKFYFPEYSEDYDKYIKNSDRLYYSNGFIMRSQDYDNYASFLFSCLNLYAQMANIKTPQDLVEHVRYNLEVGKYKKYQQHEINDRVLRWQCSICGFLSERIWTLWVQHNFRHSRICELPYLKMEPDKMYT